MSLPAEQQEDLVSIGIDVNAHLKVEMVLNDDFDNFDDNYFDNIICYDSEGDSSQEYDAVTSQTQGNTSETSSDLGKAIITKKKSNAAQMRKYRAKQRSDPERYQIYLERERTRNHKRKYEKRVQAAQDRAIEMGLPYIVLEPFTPASRRGRKPKYGFDDPILYPQKFEDQKSDLLCTDPNDSMYSMPLKVELTELDGVYQERKPHISVVNIEKLTNRPRSALQTLLPQELNDRERKNFIKLDHDYVRAKTEPIDESFYNWMKINQNSTVNSKNMSNKMNRDELLKMQEQCRNFIPRKSTTSNDSLLIRSPRLMKRKTSKTPSRRRKIVDLMQNNSGEHEDLDDLFKELEEVANKEEPKKKKSKTSPVKKQHAEFSLTVQMPVQPMIPSKSENQGENPRLDNSEFVKVKSCKGSKIDNICEDEMRWWNRILHQEGVHKKEQHAEQVEDVFIGNIKNEPDDDFCF